MKNKYIKDKINTAFSLIELSIVVLIIGILIAGVTQGSRMVAQSRLTTAISMTSSSPVNSIPDLFLWLDATDSPNIAVGTALSGVYGSAEDNDNVTNWRSRNPQSTDQINFSAALDTNRPKYTRNGINNLPTINFDGISDTILSPAINSSQILSKNQVTIFCVVKFSSIVSGANTLFIYQLDPANRVASQFNASVVRFDYGNASVVGSPGILNGATNIVGKNYIITYDKNITTQSVYLNGADEASQSSNQVVGNFSSTIRLGSYTSTTYFSDVNISEFIIFGRSLKASERKDVEKYLSQKYQIPLS